MSREDETEAAAESPRSYCVFERDSLLPRPASRMTVMNEANFSPRGRATASRAIIVGFGSLAVALLWLAYFAS